jgi:colicin import membrane protein
MGTEVALFIEVKNPLEVFGTPNGLDAVIDQIEQKAKAELRDISTEEGRDNIRSLAFNIAKSKKYVEKMGKDLTKTLRDTVDTINEERDRGIDRLQKLQDEIRQPLTEFEEKEEKRTNSHEDALLLIRNLVVFEGGAYNLPFTAYQDRIDQLPELMKREWEEFSARAIQLNEEVLNTLTAERDAAKKREDDAAELIRLQAIEKEATEKFIAMHTDAEKDNAAFDATKTAEAKAAKDAKDAADKAEQQLAAANKKASDDADAAAKALKDAEDKRVADLAAAQKKAEDDKAAALKKQTDDADAAKAAQDKAEAARAADENNRRIKNNAAMGDILKALHEATEGADPMAVIQAQAKAIIIAIAKGEVSNVRINY